MPDLTDQLATCDRCGKPFDGAAPFKDDDCLYCLKCAKPELRKEAAYLEASKRERYLRRRTIASKVFVVVGCSVLFVCGILSRGDTGLLVSAASFFVAMLVLQEYWNYE